MKNTYSVFHSDREFILTQFFDVDTQTDGVDVHDENNNFIGEIWGIVIPDVTDENEIEKFESDVKTWITDNNDLI